MRGRMLIAYRTGGLHTIPFGFARHPRPPGGNRTRPHDQSDHRDRSGCPRPLCPQPDRLAPCRRRTNGALQLALRLRRSATARVRRHDDPAHRGYRPQPVRRGATEGIFEILHWFGIDWDEGAGCRRSARPLYPERALGALSPGRPATDRQGARLSLFLHAGALAAAPRGTAAKGAPPGYDRHCRVSSQGRDRRQARRRRGLRRSLRHAARGQQPRSTT